MINNRTSWFVPFSILCLLVFSHCDKKLIPHKETELKLGTYVSISIYDQGIQESKLSEAISDAFEAVDSMENLTSRHQPTSELQKVNSKAAKQWIQVDPTLFHIIKKSKQIASATHGCFDPTIAPILDLWQFGTEHPQKPEKSNIQALIPLVNYKNVLLDSPNVRFFREGMAIDFGGIAKGSAIDAAADRLSEHGMHDFMIDAGGDLAIQSSDLTKGRIRVWIRHPRKKESLFGYFFLDSGCVATSGDYEQYFEENGQRYHHLINPKTGYPATEVMSVTVVAETAEIADAYSTAIFVMGWDMGIEFIEKHPGIEAVMLKAKENKIEYWTSKTFMKKLHIIDDSL